MDFLLDFSFVSPGLVRMALQAMDEDHVGNSGVGICRLKKQCQAMFWNPYRLSSGLEIGRALKLGAVCKSY